MTQQIAALGNVADAKMRSWLVANQFQRRSKSGPIEKQLGPYIVISREFGAGGSEIAAGVGKKLGWDVLDKEILDYMSENYGTPRDLLEFVDETHVSWIEEIFESWVKRQKFSQAAYVQRLNQLFMLAAGHGRVVIVGRGAQFILPRDRGLAVRILAPFEFRVEQVLLQRGLSEKEARKLVEESDQQRHAFVKQYFHNKSTDPHVYDLIINVEKLVREDAANLIAAAAQSWMKRSGIGQGDPVSPQDNGTQSS